MEEIKIPYIQSSDKTPEEVIYESPIADIREVHTIATPIPTGEKSGKKSTPWNESMFRNVMEGAISKVKDEVYAKVLPRLIECLGIFVALFAFVSVNIQIFSKVTSLNTAMAFAVLMFLCLAGFAYLLHIFLSEEKNSIIAFFAILACGVLLAFLFIYILPQKSLK